MDLTLVDTLIFLPPLILAGIAAFYRNTILCFWDCNPVGLKVKQFALMVRDFPTQLMAKISTSTALMLNAIYSKALLLVNTIQGIVITIKTQILAIFTHLLCLARNFTETVKNTTLSIFQSSPKSDYGWIVWTLVAIVVVGILVWISYGYTIASVQEPKVPEPEPAPQMEQLPPIRKPIRRRGRKVD